MKVCVIHSDLNPCGGAEKLVLVTLQTLLGMKMDVELLVARQPDTARISKAFGSKYSDILDCVRVGLLGRIPLELDKQNSALVSRHGDDSVFNRYDLIINAHADVLPYFVPSFSSKPFITYCHFPSLAEYARDRDLVYLQSLVDLGLLENAVLEHADKPSFWQSLLAYYFLMLRSSLIITNSRFSQNAIVDEMGRHGLYPVRNVPAVIPPPVHVDEIRSAVLHSSPREDFVLVISRLHPSKNLENAIEVARLLKERKVGKKMFIVGNILPKDAICRAYKEHLAGLVRRYDLTGYVDFVPNMDIGNLWKLMKRAKVYLHPMPREPFGISAVEAMAAGLVPVVPNTGGLTEFIPRKYQFATLDEAVGNISAGLQVPDRERLEISDSVTTFSIKSYTERLALFLG